jgi:hypothetical protein
MTEHSYITTCSKQDGYNILLVEKTSWLDAHLLTNAIFHCTWCFIDFVITVYEIFLRVYHINCKVHLSQIKANEYNETGVPQGSTHGPP